MASARMARFDSVSAAACDVPITRDELEGVIHESVATTAAELLTTIAQAGATPDQITRYCLVGGGSHIPLVARLVADAAGGIPSAGSSPEKAVVLGAARVALGALAAATTAVIPIVRPAVSATEPTTPNGTATQGVGGMQATDQRPADATAATKRPARRRGWRRPAVLLPLSVAAAAIVVATVTTVALRDRALGPVVDAASAATAQSTTAPSTATPTAGYDETGATATTTPSVTLAINGPSKVAVGDSDHYTASYDHPELVASCRWTDTTGKVVKGCGWLPVSFADAASYTLQFTIVQTTGETQTVTKTITAT